MRQAGARGGAGARVVVWLAIVLCGGTLAGYGVVRYRQLEARLDERLAAAQQRLADQAAALEQIQSDRDTVVEAYESLKQQLKDKVEAIDGLEAQRTRLRGQVAQVVAERDAIEGELDRLTAEAGEREELRSRVGVLQHRVVALEAELESARVALQTVPPSVGGRRLQAEAAPAAHEQAVPPDLAGTQAAALDEQLALTKDGLEQLRRQYDALTAALRVRREEASALEAQVREERDLVARRLRVADEHEAQWRAQLGDAYARLAELYVADRRYSEAARAYERLLEFHDDPSAHAALAALYAQYLRNPARARVHAAQAGGEPILLPRLPYHPHETRTRAEEIRWGRGPWRTLYDWLIQ